MQLRQAKPFGVFDDHHGGIGHIDTHLNHRGRHQHVQLTAGKLMQHIVFFFRPLIPPGKPHSKPIELLFH